MINPRKLFLSHESSQKTIMAQLAAALKTHNIDVWFDQEQVESFDTISQKVLDGLWSCHGFLAWWYGEYGGRPACQFELAAALASVAAAGGPGTPARIFLVAPEEVLSDPVLGRLKAERAEIIQESPPTAAHIDALAAKLAGKLRGLDTPFFRLADTDPARPTEPSNPEFVGRARELLELHAGLWPDPPGVAGTGSAQGLVAGLGGQGKTALADEYARRFARSYPYRSFRLDLQGDAEVAAGLDARIASLLRTQAERLGLHPDPRATGEELRGALERALTGVPPYLWRVDDVPGFVTEAQVQALRAPTNQGATLFTSRYELPTVTPYPLMRLRDDDALRLIRKIAGDQAPAADLRRLIDYVDGHALSLRLLAFWLADGGDVSAMIAELRATPLEGLEAFALHLDHEDEKLRSIKATLRTTLLRLPANGAGAGGGRPLLGLLAHLARAPVPVAFLRTVLGEKTLVPAVRRLRRSGLLDRHTEPSGSKAEATELVRLHPLLADLALAEPGFADAPEVPDWLAAVDSALGVEAGEIIKDHSRAKTDPLSRWLLPHLRVRAAAGLAQGTAEMAGNFGRVLYLIGSFPEARALKEVVVETCRRTLGPEHPDTLRSLNNLAGTLRAQGDLPGARALQEEALEAQGRILEAEHRDTLTSLSNLATTLRAEGDLPGARALQEQVLEAQGRILGPEHRDTLISLSNLALTLCAQGNLSGARALQEEVLEVRRRTFAPEHPDTLTSLSNLATTLWTQGDLPGARALEEQVLEARRHTLGPEHPDTLRSLNNLAETLSAQGDLPGARALQEQVLEARRRTLGPEHPDTLRSLNNLAATLRAQGDLSGARAHMKTVVEARRKTLGVKHPEALASEVFLALVLIQQGDLTSARGLIGSVLRRAADITDAQTLAELRAITALLRLPPP
jgi:hypothetical protein